MSIVGKQRSSTMSSASSSLPSTLTAQQPIHPYPCIKADDSVVMMDMMEDSFLPLSASSHPTTAVAAAAAAAVENGNRILSPHELNNVGVALLNAGRRSDAANSFLRALWQVEQTNGIHTHGVNGQSFSSSTDSDVDPMDGTRGSSFPSHDPSSSAAALCAGERASPSSYIFQREEAYDEGLHVYQHALAMPNESLRLEQLLILRYNMGQVYLRFQQYNQARRWFQTAWIIAQQLHLKQQAGDTPTTATVPMSRYSVYLLHNLGFCYYCLAQNEQALQCYRDSLTFIDTVVVNNSNNNHLFEDPVLAEERATAYNCVAVLLFHRSTAKNNDTEQALQLLQQAKTTLEGLYGPTSPQVATCLGNIGRVHFLTSNHEDAFDTFHKAYIIRKQVLGSDSMDTAAMLFNLGQSFHYRGAIDQAMDAYTEFLRVARDYFGNHCSITSSATGIPHHRDICAVQRAMAQICRQRGQREEACELLRQAFEAGCGSVGRHEKEVSCILSELGSLHAELHEYEKAIDCFLQFLQSQELVHGETDPLHANIIITKINLARVYKHSNDYISAFRYYKDVRDMQIQVPTCGPNSLEVASTLSSMGLMLYLMHAYKPSLDCYQDALRIRLDKLGTSQHPDVAETINSIGLVLFKLGLMEMAKEAFQECIKLRSMLQKHGVGTSKSSCCHSNTSNAEATACCSGNERHDVTSELAESKEIAVLYFNLATACMQNGEDDQGMDWYKESLRVERKVLGEDHPDVILTLQHIARVYEENGDFRSAIEYYSEALEIAQRVGATDSNKNYESVTRLLRQIGNLYFMLGCVSETMTFFREAHRVEQQHMPNESGATQTTNIECVSASAGNFYALSKLHPLASAAA